MNIKRNKILINFFKTLPNKPSFLSPILKKLYQQKLNKLLTQSMEDFNYIGLKLALIMGANPNVDAQSKKGYHLVTRAARSGETLFLETLINFGGDIHGNAGIGGYLPLHMAATKGMDKAIQTLIQYGEDINSIYILDEFKNRESIFPNGWTALICACIHNKAEAGKTLLDLGANPFDVNEYGISALDIAKKMHNDELVEYILQKQQIKSLLPNI